MALVMQSDDEIRSTLTRIVTSRWPDECLIFTTECERDRQNPTSGVAAHQPGRMGGMVLEPVRTDHGLVGATQNRLIYHCKSAFISLLRGVGAALACIAMLILLFGSGLSGFLPAAAAAAFYVGGNVLDLFVAAGASLPYDDICLIDETGQWIDAA